MKTQRNKRRSNDHWLRSQLNKEPRYVNMLGKLFIRSPKGFITTRYEDVLDLKGIYSEKLIKEYFYVIKEGSSSYNEFEEVRKKFELEFV